MNTDLSKKLISASMAHNNFDLHDRHIWRSEVRFFSARLIEVSKPFLIIALVLLTFKLLA